MAGTCHACGAAVGDGRAVRVTVPCPACAVFYNLALCTRCAQKLLEDVLQQLYEVAVREG